MPPATPTTEQISQWLREHVKKNRPGRFARWFGEPENFTYDVGRPVEVPVRFLIRHRLFSVDGEDGLLPLPALPSGSWGIFVTDGDTLQLLEPETGSLSSLLARENRPLDQGDPADVARLFSLVLVTGREPTHHEIVASADEIRQFRWGLMDGYQADDTALRLVEHMIVPPAIGESPTGGWILTFTTVAGWMHELYELGVETFEISGQFTVVRHPRQILHPRIFQKVPGVLY